jgi:hypothetical protein
MSYDKSNQPIKYGPGLFDFGTGSAANHAILGPKGKKGLLIDYGVEGSVEAFTATTTVPSVSVGTTSDPDAYGDELSLNGLAINSMKTVRTTYRDAESGFTTQMVDRTLPADTTVYLVLNPGTGSPTGQAYPWAIILWDD